MDIRKATAATEATLHMSAIGIATMLACIARGIPIIRNRGFIVEGAMCFSPVHRSLWANHSCERMIAAKSTLCVDAVRPAAKHAQLAFGIPVVGNVRLVLEAATACWAWDCDIVSPATQAAFHMLAIAVAPQVAELTRRIPEEADVNGFVVEVALALHFGQWRWRRHSRKGIELASAASDSARPPQAHQLEALPNSGANCRRRTTVSGG